MITYLEKTRKENIFKDVTLFNHFLNKYCHQIHPIPNWYSGDWHRTVVINPKLTMAEWLGFYVYIDKTVRE